MHVLAALQHLLQQTQSRDNLLPLLLPTSPAQNTAKSCMCCFCKLLRSGCLWPLAQQQQQQRQHLIRSTSAYGHIHAPMCCQQDRCCSSAAVHMSKFAIRGTPARLPPCDCLHKLQVLQAAGARPAGASAAHVQQRSCHLFVTCYICI